MGLFTKLFERREKEQGNPHGLPETEGLELPGSLPPGGPDQAVPPVPTALPAEEVTVGGVSRMEQRWTFQVTPASRLELHVEAFHTGQQADFELTAFEYSTDGSSFTTLTLVSLQKVDSDEAIPLPSNLTGSVIVRLVDTDRTPLPGPFPKADTVEVDELFIRRVD